MNENGAMRRPIILGEFPILSETNNASENAVGNEKTRILEQLLEKELAELSRQYPNVSLEALDKALYRGAVAFATYVHSQAKITPPGGITEKIPVLPSAQNFPKTPGDEHLPPVQSREVHDRPDNESVLRGAAPRSRVMPRDSDVIIAVNGIPGFQGFS